MSELVQVNGTETSAFGDVYPKGGPGFHPEALIVDCLTASNLRLQRSCFDEAFFRDVALGSGFAEMDATAQSGCFAELHESSPEFVGFFDLGRDASANCDGQSAHSGMEF